MGFHLFSKTALPRKVVTSQTSTCPDHSSSNSIRSDHSQSISETRSNLSLKSLDSKKSTSKQKKKLRSSRKQQRVNVKTAKAFVKLWNEGDLDQKAEFVSLWVCDQNRRTLLEDGYSFKASEMADAILELRQSFPDLEFQYQSITAKKDQVIIEGVRCSGTHTGVPYSIAPGKVSALPATGTHCANDEERFCLQMDDQGKIKTCRVIGLGGHTGFAGFYEQASC